MDKIKLNGKANKCLLRELPYFSYRGDLVYVHGKFNNSLSTRITTRRDLEHLTGLYDLDLFSLNNQSSTDENIPVIRSNYYSPHSFENMINSLPVKEAKESFSIFHNNVRSLRGNFENLEEYLFSNSDFNFDLIGISETKI